MPVLFCIAKGVTKCVAVCVAVRCNVCCLNKNGVGTFSELNKKRGRQGA